MKKEKIERILTEAISGKKVLNEVTKPVLNIEDLEQLKPSAKVKEVIPSNIKEWLLFQKQVNRQYDLYFQFRKDLKEKTGEEILKDFDITEYSYYYYSEIYDKILEQDPFKHSLIEVLRSCNAGLKGILRNYFFHAGLDLETCLKINDYISSELVKIYSSQSKTSEITKLQNENEGFYIVGGSITNEDFKHIITNNVDKIVVQNDSLTINKNLEKLSKLNILKVIKQTSSDTLKVTTPHEGTLSYDVSNIPFENISYFGMRQQVKLNCNSMIIGTYGFGMYFREEGYHETKRDRQRILLQGFFDTDLTQEFLDSAKLITTNELVLLMSDCFRYIDTFSDAKIKKQFTKILPTLTQQMHEIFPGAKKIIIK